MSFDRLAAHYRWLEFVLAGEKLQRCRIAFLDQVTQRQNVLMVGEGNGRFLLEFRNRLPAAHITCVDASSRMLELARARLLQHRPSVDRVDFVHADALSWTTPSQTFDLIVTHFFLDCFRPDQLSRLIPKLAAAANSAADWLIADFRMPTSGWRRIRAGLIHRLMYVFFRIITRLPARELAVPDDLVASTGFRLQSRQLSEWGLLHTDRWLR